LRAKGCDRAKRCDLRCSICQSARVEEDGELADFVVLRCSDCGSRRRGERLEDRVEVPSSDPFSFDPDDTANESTASTANESNASKIDRLELEESQLLETLRRIRLELPKVQTQLRELYSQEVA
jgi:hypothetical protein